jgi:hypothetical protein
MALQNSRKMMMLIIIVAPAFEPTAVRKMRTKAAVGAVVSSSRAWISSALKSTAKSIPIASEPLMMRLRSIDRGTSVLAFLTSSDIYKREQSCFGWSVLTYMDNRIGANESQSITLQPNKEC